MKSKKRKKKGNKTHSNITAPTSQCFFDFQSPSMLIKHSTNWDLFLALNASDEGVWLCCKMNACTHWFAYPRSSIGLWSHICVFQWPLWVDPLCFGFFICNFNSKSNSVHVFLFFLKCCLYLLKWNLFICFSFGLSFWNNFK